MISQLRIQRPTAFVERTMLCAELVIQGVRVSDPLVSPPPPPNTHAQVGFLIESWEEAVDALRSIMKFAPRLSR